MRELTKREKIEGMIAELQSLLENEERLLKYTAFCDETISYGAGVIERKITINYAIEEESIKGKCLSRLLREAPKYNCGCNSENDNEAE